MATRIKNGIRHYYVSPEERALAAVCASMDGKLEEFLKGERAKSIMAHGGHYAGYCAEAEEQIARLKRRGFKIVRIRK